MTCVTAGLTPDETTGLRCRFGAEDVSATYDPEHQQVTCCPPKSCSNMDSCTLQVIAGNDKVVYAEQRFSLLPSHEEMTSTSDEKVPGDGKESLRDRAKREFSGLKPFIIISLSYILYTMTDGAVRMIVLLHAFRLKFTAWEVALMFTLYELAGVFTNLAAGLMGAKWGIKWTLLAGLSLQLSGLGMLFGWQDHWNKIQAIIFVTCAQLLCGIAKDLTKLGGKTVTKLVTPEEKQGRLFKLVSFITGWKNSFKGVGYFIGAALLTVPNGYYVSLAVQCAFILLAFPWAVISLDHRIGRAKKENATLSQIFTKNPQINYLSLSRVFLFGSRDLWFEVVLPFFLRDKVVGMGWSRPAVGAFLAGFIIFYGQVQSWTPQLILKPLRQFPANRNHAALWAALLIGIPIYLGGFISFSSIYENRETGPMAAVLITGLYVFCILFAVNSAIHSYLIVKYSENEKAAMNIGFYYCSNAIGRLTGTLVSGALYNFAGSSKRVGFGACFWASAGFCVLAAVIPLFIPGDSQGGLQCGLITCAKPKVEEGSEKEGYRPAAAAADQAGPE